MEKFIRKENKEVEKHENMKSSNELMFHVGDLFDSYEDLMEKLEAHSKAFLIHYWRRDSRTVNGAHKKTTREISPRLKYYSIKFACVYGGQRFFSRGNGQRQHQTQRTNCPAHILLRASLNGQQLEVTSVNNDHNHEISVESYQNLRQERKLPDSFKSEIQDLLKMGIDKKRLKVYINKCMNKILHTKDLLNIAASNRNSEVLSEERVCYLLNKLKETESSSICSIENKIDPEVSKSSDTSVSNFKIVNTAHSNSVIENNCPDTSVVSGEINDISFNVGNDDKSVIVEDIAFFVDGIDCNIQYNNVEEIEYKYSDTEKLESILENRTIDQNESGLSSVINCEIVDSESGKLKCISVEKQNRIETNEQLDIIKNNQNEHFLSIQENSVGAILKFDDNILLNPKHEASKSEAVFKNDNLLTSSETASNSSIDIQRSDLKCERSHLKSVSSKKYKKLSHSAQNLCKKRSEDKKNKLGSNLQLKLAYKKYTISKQLKILKKQQNKLYKNIKSLKSKKERLKFECEYYENKVNTLRRTLNAEN